MSDDAKYYLGCPIWASEAWLGTLYTSKAKRADWLSQYAQVFNTVEGNNTFYGLPGDDAVRKWIDATPAGFRFCLKFPRDLSHERQLLQAEQASQPFLAILETLHKADRLGPSFLQLPPTFDGRRLGDLAVYLHGLPREFPYAVEVRHPDYYDEGPYERGLNDLLKTLEIELALLDSRPLYQGPPKTTAEVEAQGRKPKSPYRDTRLGKRPFVRLIGRDALEETTPWIDDPWAPTTARWIQEGATPYMFLHTPDYAFAPATARRFHEALRKLMPELPPLPAFPGESDQRPKQKRLF